MTKHVLKKVSLKEEPIPEKMVSLFQTYMLQIAMRAMHLEHDNAMLTAQNLTLREEIQTLRQLIIKCNKSPPAN